METSALRRLLRRGKLVFSVLIALTLVEYALALVMDSGNLPWMIVMNVIDAWLILYFFMHVHQLWRREE